MNKASVMSLWKSANGVKVFLQGSRAITNMAIFRRLLLGKADV